MVNNMSDPVTNAEVEDVLSSIRRLVSEDRRPINRAKSEAQFEDKLVLTPSLRVSNDAPLVDAYKKQTQDIAPTEWDDRAIGNAVETKAVEAKAGDDTLDDYDASGQFDGDHLEFRDSDDLYAGLDTDADFPEWQDAADEKPADDAHASGDLEAVNDTDLAGDDLGGPPLKLHTPSEIAESNDQAKGADWPTSVSTASRRNILNLGDSELVEDVPPTPDRLSAKIAALESAISRIPENWEPDAPGDDDYSGSEGPAMVWEDDVELDAKGAPLAHLQSVRSDEDVVDATPDADQVAAQGNRFGGDDDHFEEGDHFEEDQGEADAGIGLGSEEFLDEAMLRDLVSEIVRSELQGVLGERITRNVRKLVRREIHRALTAQELE